MAGEEGVLCPFEIQSEPYSIFICFYSVIPLVAPRSTISKETCNLLNLILYKLMQSKIPISHSSLYHPKEVELQKTDTEKLGLRKCYCVYNLY